MHDAERDFGLAEHGTVGGQDNVARHGQLAAAAKRVARDRGDDRLADRADLVERREEIAAIGLDEGLGMHLLDVDASGKRLFVAGDDDGTDGRIALERLKRPVELADELRVERVQRVRAVQRNEPDLAPVSYTHL